MFEAQGPTKEVDLTSPNHNSDPQLTGLMREDIWIQDRWLGQSQA